MRSLRKQFGVSVRIIVAPNLNYSKIVTPQKIVLQNIFKTHDLHPGKYLEKVTDWFAMGKEGSFDPFF